MSGAVRKHWYLFGLITVFIVGVPFAAQAQYTKYYEFDSTAAQSGVDATIFGYEYITSTYSNAWGDGAWGYGPLPYTTTVGFDGASTTEPVAVGWTTWDMSCFLWDLRWTSGDPIMPTEASGVPGGGYVTWDDGTATWTITNHLLADPPDPVPDPPEDMPAAGDGLEDTPGDGAPTILLPGSFTVSVLDDPLDFQQLGQAVGPPPQEIGLLGSSSSDETGANAVPYITLGPGQSFPITIPDVQFGQTLFLTGPMLDSQGHTVGYFGEQVTVTPEPCTLILLACTGLPLLGRLRRRRK